MGVMLDEDGICGSVEDVWVREASDAVANMDVAGELVVTEDCAGGGDDEVASE